MTVMEVNVGGGAVGWDTVIGMEPVIDPCVAVTVTEPAFTAVRSPEALMEAIVASEVFHVTCAVRLAVLLSLKAPMAENCKVEPTAAVVAEPALVTLIEASVGGVLLEGCCEVELVL